MTNSVQKSTKKLANRSLEYLKNKFAENNMGTHIDNVSLMSWGDRYKAGFAIMTGGDDVITFNEFGTGVVGEGTGRLANEYGYKYNVGEKIGEVPEAAVSWYARRYRVDEETAREILEAETTPNTWWYFKDKKWHRTEGMRGKNMFADLADMIREEGFKDFAISLTTKSK